MRRTLDACGCVCIKEVADDDALEKSAGIKRGKTKEKEKERKQSLEKTTATSTTQKEGCRRKREREKQIIQLNIGEPGSVVERKRPYI